MLLDRGLSLFAFVDDGNTTSLKLLRFYLSGYLYVLLVIADEDMSKMVNGNTRCIVMQKCLIKGATESYECTPLGSYDK